MHAIMKTVAMVVVAIALVGTSSSQASAEDRMVNYRGDSAANYRAGQAAKVIRAANADLVDSDDYAGSAIVEEGVEFKFTRELSEVEKDRLRQASPGVPVVFATARFSHRELNAQVKQISKDRPGWWKKGVPISGWGVDVTNNRVNVRLSRYSDQARDRLKEVYGDIINVAEFDHKASRAVKTKDKRENASGREVDEDHPHFTAEEPNAAYNRFNDAPPWTGGLALGVENNQFFCTGGFNMSDRSSVPYRAFVTTAAHCSGDHSGPVPDDLVNGPDDELVGTVDRRYFEDGGLDVEAAPTANQFLGVFPDIWGQGADEKTYRPVRGGDIADEPADEICTSGAFTDEACGAVVVEANVCETFAEPGDPEAIETCNLVYAAHPSDNICVEGDSGGPVFQPVPGDQDRGVLAKGMIIGCGTDDGSPSNEVFYHPIRAVTDRLGLELSVNPT